MRLRHQSRPLRSDESGSMLIELVIAMTFILIAVGALMTSYASSMVSLHRSGTQGTALTLADRQIEAYKSLPYDSIQLASSTIPGGTDPYVTAHSSDATIPSSTGQITGGTTASPCTASTQAVVGCATQAWTGPDNQPYRVDTYIVTATPSGRARHQADNGRRAPDGERLAELQDLEPCDLRVRSIESASVTALRRVAMPALLTATTRCPSDEASQPFARSVVGPMVIERRRPAMSAGNL